MMQCESGIIHEACRLDQLETRDYPTDSPLAYIILIKYVRESKTARLQTFRLRITMLRGPSLFKQS